MKRLRDLTAVLGMVALTACNNASIEGSWVEPVPGMPGMQQGFRYQHRQSPGYFLHGYADNRKTDAGQPDSQKKRVALEICQEQ